MCNWFKKLFNPIYRLTDDEKIVDALKLCSEPVIDRLCEKSVKIRWENLNNFDGYTKYAARAKDFMLNDYILLNNQFQKAPSEQIACLITHESVHTKIKTDLEEEVEATTQEIITWLYLKKDIEYESTPLYNRLEKLSAMNYDQIKGYILENKLYESILTV